MRRSRLRRWQLVTVIFTAAGMLALLVYLVQVGLAKAVAISTVLALFVAVAALLVSVLSIQLREPAEPATKPVTAPSSGEPLGHKMTLTLLQPLTAAAALLGVALCTFVSDALLKYSASWPWWVAAAAAFLGLAAAASGVGTDVTRAAILILNTLWFFSYSVIIVEYRQSSSPGSIGQLVTLSWIGTAANALFLAIVAARGFRLRRAPTSRLELQTLFLSCLAIGMALTAIALRGSSNVPWDLAGLIFTAALLADLVEPSAADTVNLQETPEDGEHTPSGDQRWRRFPRWAGILAGTAVAAGLIVVIVIPARPRATAPRAGPASSAASPAVIFRDEFSSRANGWTAVVGDGDYSNGTYHLSTPPSTLVTLAIPQNAGKVSPSAPQNISIDVTARSLADPGENDYYGIACRQGPWGAYLFLVGDQVVYAEKWTGGLNTGHDNPNVNFNGSAKATNQLRAVCTNEGPRSVHLMFWVNGQKVANWTDRQNPFLKGTVGLADSSTSNTKLTRAEFDNFVVRKA